MDTSSTHKHGDLKVWWIPQIPMDPFEVTVKSVSEAVLLLETLADYDIFQFENRIKPDYCNAGGLVAYDAEANDWYDWESEDGESIDDVRRNHDFLAALP